MNEKIPHIMWQPDRQEIFNATIAGLHDIMVNGDSLTVRGFGASTVKACPTRTGRTGLPMNIEAKTVPVFKPSAAFKDAANHS